MIQRHEQARRRSSKPRQVNHSKIALERASMLGLAKALGSGVVTKKLAERARKAFSDHPLRQFFERKRNSEGCPRGPRSKERKRHVR